MGGTVVVVGVVVVGGRVVVVVRGGLVVVVGRGGFVVVVLCATTATAPAATDAEWSWPPPAAVTAPPVPRSAAPAAGLNATTANIIIETRRATATKESAE